MARKPKAGPPVMTNKAALYVLYDLAGGRMKGWKALERDLDANVQDIYKRNRPWPSGFGPKEYCKAFTRYADEGHTSHYAALIAVKRSLEDSNALTPEVKAIFDNVRPDVDEQVAKASLARVMETIVETALPYNKVGAAAGEEGPRGDGGAPVPDAVAGPTNRTAEGSPSDARDDNRARGRQAAHGAGDLACAGFAAASGTGRAVRLLASCVRGLDAEGLLTRVVPASLMRILAPAGGLRAVCAASLTAAPRDALADALCQDGGLACRKMQRSCQELARASMVEEAAVLVCAQASIDEGSGKVGPAGAGSGRPETPDAARAPAVALGTPCSAGTQATKSVGPAAAESRRAASLFHRYADGDAGRALFAAILLFLVGPRGFNRVMACPDTATLFDR